MVKITIENKNGIYTKSDLVEINKEVSLIRIIRLEPIKDGSNNNVKDVVEDFHISGEWVFLEKQISAYNYPVNSIDIVYYNFIKNTDDLIFKLVENSKIAVEIYSGGKVNPTRDLTKFTK